MNLKEAILEVKKLINQYPRCIDCDYSRDGKCTLPIVEYDDLSKVMIACPKDQIVLKIKKLLRECDET